MATAPVSAPGRASRIGTIDPMGKTRVYVNEMLEPVEAGSADAAFVFKKGELERFRDRRTELGLARGDEALRTYLDSQKVEQAAAQRRLAAVQAENDAIEEAVSAFRTSLKAAQKAGAASADAGTADASSQAPKPGSKAALQARATELGVEPGEMTVAQLEDVIAKAEAEQASGSSGSGSSGSQT